MSRTKLDAFGNFRSKFDKTNEIPLTKKEKEKIAKEHMQREKAKPKKSKFIPLEEMRKRVKKCALSR